VEFLNFDHTMLIRLVVAVILGGLVGWERNSRNAEAGLRTHIILCLGAALVMIISESLYTQYGVGDITRMSAQVISGVGFLGVGSIIVNGNRIRGITTAAGLWTTACVGLAIGSGHYVLAATVVALMLFAMWILPMLTKGRRRKKKYYPADRKTVESEMADSKKFDELLDKLDRLEEQISLLKGDIERQQEEDD